jgi:hypothetical protein
MMHGLDVILAEPSKNVLGMKENIVGMHLDLSLVWSNFMYSSRVSFLVAPTINAEHRQDADFFYLR